MKYHETPITVRFNEIDAYQVAWHGHYVSWMEIGRVALASKFNLDPLSLSKDGYLGPVISIDIKYLRPARFNEQLIVKTGLLRTETTTLRFKTEIVDVSGNRLATGVTTHAMTNLEGVLQFQLPPNILDRIEKMAEWLEAI